MDGLKRVAITGGIAEGKSTVLGYLSDMGYRVASADVLAREVFLTDEVQKALAGLLSVDGKVSPDMLRSRIATNSIRRSVNAITHPKIVERIRSVKADFIEVPLLVETCLQAEFQRIWVVTCGAEEQRRRLMGRMGNPMDVERLIGTQLTSRVKISFADRVFRTNQTEAAVQRLVTVAVQRDLG